MKRYADKFNKTKFSEGEKASKQGLTPAELTKYGPKRIKVLKEKIENCDVMIKIGGDKIIAPKEKNQTLIKDLQQAIQLAAKGDEKAAMAMLKQGRTSKTLNVIDQDGAESKIYISKLSKSDDFGGGTKTSNGKNTAQGEAAVAVFLRCLLNGSGTVQNNSIVVSEPNFIKAYHECDIKIKLDFILNDIIANKSWNISSQASAIKLYNSIFIKANNKKNIICHHNSKFMNAVYDAFKEVNRNDRAFAKGDKWNPGDIWLVDNTKQALIESKLKSVQSWKQLNHLIKTSGGYVYNGNSTQNPHLIGISLKKTSGSPRITKHNINAQSTQIDIKFNTNSTHIITAKKDFFNSKDIFLKFDRHIKDFNGNIISTKKDALMQFRCFETNKASWQGEIKGKGANGGKIGHGSIAVVSRQVLNMPYGYINPYLNDVDSSSTKIINKAFDDLKKGPGTKEYDLIANNMYKVFIEYSEHTESYNTYEKFEAELRKKNADWLISKYAGLLLIKRIYDNKHKASEFVLAMNLYSASESVNSSAFIKCWD